MAVSHGIIAQLLETVTGLLLLCLACWFYWTHRKILAAARKLPVIVPAMPLIGHCYLMVYGVNRLLNLGIRLIKQLSGKTGYDKGVVWFGPYPFFLIFTPEDVQTLLSSKKSFEGGLEQSFLGYALGNGLITAPVNMWKVTRRHVNALFHPRNLEQLMPMLNLCAQDLVASLNHQAGKGHFDVELHVNPIALKSTCLLIFGPETEVNVKDDTFKNLMTALTRISELVADRFTKFWLWSDPIFRFLYKKEIQKINNGCDDFIIEALKSSRKQRAIKENTIQLVDYKETSHANNEEPKTYTDAVESVTLAETYKVLQQSYPAITEEDLKYEVRTVLLGGSESTRVTLSSCLLALAAHPHIQERLYAEIVSVMGVHDSDVTTEDIRAMPYLDQVLKETLRKFLVIPTISGWTIPAGALVGLVLFGVHFNTKLYPDPEKFDPDRFSSENVASRAKYSFVPFSSGPRNCIGKNYSMLVLKTLLVQVLRRFKLSTDVDIDAQTLNVGIVTALKDGYELQLDLRH